MKKPAHRRKSSADADDEPCEDVKADILSMLGAVEAALRVGGDEIAAKAEPKLVERFEALDKYLSLRATEGDEAARSARVDALILLDSLLMRLEQKTLRSLALSRFLSEIRARKIKQTKPATNAKLRNSIANDFAVEFVLNNKRPSWLRAKNTDRGIAAGIADDLGRLFDWLNTQPEFEAAKAHPLEIDAISKRVKRWKAAHPEIFPKV